MISRLSFDVYYSATFPPAGIYNKEGWDKSVSKSHRNLLIECTKYIYVRTHDLFGLSLITNLFIPIHS